MKTTSLDFLRRVFLPCLAVLAMASCNSAPGNPKVPAGAKSSGGKHAVIETDKGPIEIEFLSGRRPESRRELPAARRARLLRRPDVPPHREGVHDSGRRPAGDGTGGESAWGGMFADEINPARRSIATATSAASSRWPTPGRTRTAASSSSFTRTIRCRRATSSSRGSPAGMDALDALANTPTTMGDDGGMSRPLTPPVIKKVTIRP